MLIVDAESRPEVGQQIDELVAENLPPFMMWASPGNWRWHRIYRAYPRDQVAVLDVDGSVVAALNAVPVAYGSDVPLPGGYDDVLVAAADGEPIRGALATCLLSISVRSDHRRAGFPELLLREMKARARGIDRMAIVSPLRLTRKAEYPRVPMSEYAAWATPDDEPFDPWLRTHRRLGGRILGVAERSFVVSQPHTRWEQITGRPMAVPDAYDVPGALAPVVVDARGIGTYAEPNVWIQHELDG